MILNYMWRVSRSLYAYFKSSDCEAVAQLKVRHSLSTAMLLGAKRVKEKTINDLVELLYNYKKHCGQSNNPSQLLLPESLRNLPLLILSSLKSPVSATFQSFFLGLPHAERLQTRPENCLPVQNHNFKLQRAIMHALPESLPRHRHDLSNERNLSVGLGANR